MSSVLHDPERSADAFCEAKASERGGDGLIVTATRTEKVAGFAVPAADAAGGLMILEAAHASEPALDAAVVLPEPLVRVGRQCGVERVLPSTSRVALGREPWPSVVTRSG